MLGNRFGFCVILKLRTIGLFMKKDRHFCAVTGYRKISLLSFAWLSTTKKNNTLFFLHFRRTRLYKFIPQYDVVAHEISAQNQNAIPF